MTEPTPERPDFEPPGNPQPPGPSAGPPPPVGPPSEPDAPPSVPAHPLPPAPAQHPQPRSGGRGSILLGIGITFVGILGWWALASSVSYSGPASRLFGWLIPVAPALLILAGIVLAAMPRTTRTGAGILIGIGLAVLVAGGLCIALLSTYR